MFKKTKKKPIVINEYDQRYKEQRNIYAEGIWSLKESFYRVRACNRLKNSFGWGVLEEKEQQEYTAFESDYDALCNTYEQLDRYWKDHHEEMNECKTWNTTLIHPMDFMIKWEMEK